MNSEPARFRSALVVGALIPALSLTLVPISARAQSPALVGEESPAAEAGLAPVSGDAASENLGATGPQEDDLDGGAEAPEDSGEAEPEPEPEPVSEPSGSSDASAPTDVQVDQQVDQDDPKALFLAGQDAYALGNYEEAVAHFERSWTLSGEPALLFNLGQAYWQWYSVVPDLESLRKARQLFENYRKFATEREDLDAGEVEPILAAINAQIVAAEEAARLREQFRPAPAGLDQAAIRAKQRQRTTRALTLSGSLMITLGSLALLAGAGGLVTRGAAGFSLDQAGGGEAGKSNPNTVEDDTRLRSTYTLGGQIGFGGLIGAAVFLPVGITLRIVGGSRSKRDGQERSLALAPSGTLVRVEF